MRTAVNIRGAVNDRSAKGRNELLNIACEAQGMAKLALLVYDADRLCSWLDPTQRRALLAYLRAINLLAVEAHLRSSARLPTSPGSLPIRRLCGYLVLFREALPKLMRRLRLDAQQECYRLPKAVQLNDYEPSHATMADIRSSLEDAAEALMA